MTSNSSATFKVFLKADATTEVRKFIVDDASVITSFIFIKEKLQTLFPKLRETYFKITWRDADGDDIIIDGDEDLILAFTEMEGPMKTLYVTVLSDIPQPQECGYGRYGRPSMDETPNVVCDVCNNPITAYRYKCLQCFDYDLCGTCEQAGHHSHHMMLRSSTPDLPFARCGRKVFEHVNKAFKKASHIAHREYKKKNRWEAGDRKQKCDAENSGGDGPSRQNAESSGCPFEMYGQQFYPFVEAFSNAAGAAANAAASAATAAASAAQPPGANPSSTSEQKQNADTNENNASMQFVEMIRNALNNVFVHQPQSQPTTPGTNTQTQANAFANTQPNPTASQPVPPSQSVQQPTAPVFPMAAPNAPTQIDLTTTPATEAMDTSPQSREPGWTLLNREEQLPQSHYPVLTPTVAPPLVPQDPKIAMGLQRLLEMGFNDEQALIALLKRYNGNVDEVILYIFEHK